MSVYIVIPYCFPTDQSPEAGLGISGTGPLGQSSKEDYAASKLTFGERIKEKLDPSIIEAPLTRENYKKRFHNMICWEEKRHIEILDTK